MSDVDVTELAGRLDDPALMLLDVRSPREYAGTHGKPCDPRQGHIPGARNVDVEQLLRCGSIEGVRALVGAAPGVEVVAYCHGGSRSALAAQILAAAGYEARNYAGSWHEWSRLPDLPVET